MSLQGKKITEQNINKKIRINFTAEMSSRLTNWWQCNNFNFKNINQLIVQVKQKGQIFALYFFQLSLFFFVNLISFDFEENEKIGR